MRSRKKANSTFRKKQFTKTAVKVNKRNRLVNPMRGGYRL